MWRRMSFPIDDRGEPRTNRELFDLLHRDGWLHHHLDDLRAFVTAVRHRLAARPQTAS